jgi:hypothetical protein
MAVKGTFNVDEYEQYLNDVEEGKASAKLFSPKIFKAAIVALFQLEIMIFFAASSLVKLDTPLFGFFTHELVFNWELWWSAQILEIVPIINAGFNATTNFKMRRIRNRMLAENMKLVKAKDTQITSLQKQIDSQNYILMEQKKRLDDQAILHEALSTATDLAEFKVIQRMLEREAVEAAIPIEATPETLPVEEKIEEDNVGGE